MNSVIASQPLVAPHLLQHPRLSPSLSPSPNPNIMSTRKRKAEDEANNGEGEDRMSSSPSGSPAITSRTLASPSAHRTPKRMRTDVSGRPLALPRLLETLGADEMRSLLRSICDRHPDIGTEVVATAPRPSVASSLRVLNVYESTLRESFPFGGRPSSDYAYNRVRQALANLLDALEDFTPQFLPPQEQQAATSLQFLDEATQIVYRLPDWDTYQHNRHKQEAYEEIARAWALVIREGAKRGGGIQLQYGEWDQKLAKHNDLSGGRMEEAMNELRNSLGWMGGSPAAGHGSSQVPNDSASIRQQLLSGTYGSNLPVRVGLW